LGQLRTLVLGLTGSGADFCAAAHADANVQVAALADHDKTLAENTALRYAVPFHNDYRLAIVEQEPQLILVAIPPYQRPDHLKTAAARGIPVLSTGPPLSGFDATLEIARQFGDARVPFAVTRVWQTEPAYARLTAIKTWAGDLISAHVNVLAPAGDLQGWRGDSARAGGGVLLNDGYEHIDALVSIMGLPEEVYAVLARPHAAAKNRPYDTEDTATLMMRFSSDRVATVGTRRAGERNHWRYQLHGTRATAVITPGGMVVTDMSDNSTSATRVRTANRLAPAVSAFAAALVSGQPCIPSSIQDHLATMATLRAAYLSAKTGQPESPARFYRRETGLDVKGPG
jgi:predicted dehydrogenase